MTTNTKPIARRRMLLGLAAGTAAGLTATKLLQPQTAFAADLVIGENNNAAGKRTTLRSDRNGIDLLLENRGGSDTRIALAAWAGEGGIPSPTGDCAAVLAIGDTTGSSFGFVRGVHARALGGKSASSGVFSETDAGTGVVGVSQTGVGVSAQSPSGKALDVAGSSSFSGPATFAGSVAAASFTGGGAGVTDLNAFNLATGVVPESRLPINIPRKNALSNSFTGTVRALVFGGLGTNAPAFTSSGATDIEAGRERITIFNPSATQATKVIATLQGSAGAGVTLSHIERALGKFVVVLSGKSTEKTTIAYFILR